MRHSTLQFLLEELWQYTTCFISSRVKTQGMQHLRKPLYLNMMSGIGLIKASAWSLWVKIIDISIEKKTIETETPKIWPLYQNKWFPGEKSRILLCSPQSSSFPGLHSVAIITACLPLLWPLKEHVFQALTLQRPSISSIPGTSHFLRQEWITSRPTLSCWQLLSERNRTQLEVQVAHSSPPSKASTESTPSWFLYH